MQVFVLTGKSGSGKSTVAEIIKKYYNSKDKKTIITGYASYLKLYAHLMLDWDFKESTKPRTFLQQMGSYIRTDLKMPNMLSERLLTDIDIYKHFYSVLVISDARLPEEINYLKDHIDQICVIKIEGDYNRNLTMEQLSHETETKVDLIDNYDYLIVNDTDYNGLRAKVYQLLEGLE